MRHRILVAIVGVTLVATVVLTIPLALLIAAREHQDADAELTLASERAANELTSNTDFAHSELDLPRFDRSLTVGVYLPDGRRVAGDGPATADRFTAAVRLYPRAGTTARSRIVVRPIVENEKKVAAIRVTEPLAEAERKILRDVLLLLAIDLGALVVAAIVASWVTARLVRPLTAIRDDAVRLGHGDFSINPGTSGIAEVDATAEALAETAARLDGLLQRERAFSADASHQLRTPLTSLRLAIESELESPSDDPTPVLEDAIGEIDRLEDTITTLLRVARDQPIRRDPLDVAAWLATAERRWGQVLREQGRPLTMASSVGATPRISRHVLDQIVDVLVGNAVRHGRGAVSVRIDDEGDGIVLTVTDAGRLEREPSELFTRRDPGASGHGVGLSLARTLAEAEGGRLSIVTTDPTSFRLHLPGHADVPISGGRTDRQHFP